MKQDVLGFLISGEPVAKGRPRFRVMGKFVSTYTPKKTKDEENRLKEYFKENYKEAPLECPCKIKLSFYFGIPKSYTKKKVNELISKDLWHTKKPDCDNLAKTILDSMNGIVLKDDSCVVGLDIQKKYTLFEPMTVISVEKLK